MFGWFKGHVANLHEFDQEEMPMHAQTPLVTR